MADGNVSSGRWLDGDALEQWRHETQLPGFAAMFPDLCALLGDCPVCGETPLAHLDGGQLDDHTG